MKRVLSCAAIVYLSLGVGLASAQNAFTCPWGKDAACLNYGDKICSRFGKCVDDDAVCFSRYTCDADGFMCVSDHQDFVIKARSMASDYDDFRQCVAFASDMEEVADCLATDSYR